MSCIHTCRLWMVINLLQILDLEGTPLQMSLLIHPKRASLTLGNLVQIKIRYACKRTSLVNTLKY